MFLKKIGHLHYLGHLNRDDEFVIVSGPFRTQAEAIAAL